eukprot:TRINITY_DN34427_c0_g1_i1.p1 TRINITY_DN34427_c0_g1~~TRINITY_DN34427_c0_g1_i1.p1  ORF type:complete len:217 (+),score=35.62 TRINITY_DN34427_c0_g1_i1:68-652(+)
MSCRARGMSTLIGGYTGEDTSRDQRHSDHASHSFANRLLLSAKFIYGSAACWLVLKFLTTMSPAADVLALASIEVNADDIPKGTGVMMKWRGKPVFIRHRTEKEIAEARAADAEELRDPQTDAERFSDPNWLVVLGICTHLGCVPTAGEGDYNGWYCPCHGSHYDISGRIRKGPAPLNLEVPKHELQGNTIVVG